MAPVLSADSATKGRKASAAAPQGWAALAQLRATNAWGRIVGGGVSALVLSVLVSHWLPLAWFAGSICFLLVERAIAKNLLRRTEAGKTPALAPYAVWTFVQSAYGNLFAVLAWYMEPRHGDAIAAFYLAASALNAVITLRPAPVIAFAGLSATALTMMGPPLVDLLVLDRGRGLSEFGPILAVLVLYAFGVYVWKTLRASDAAQVQASAAAERAQRLTREAQHARADFVSLMKHEVRTPMMALAGSAETLRRVSLPPEARAQADALVEASEVLAAVLDDLVDLDAMESGRLEIRPVKTDPRAMTRSVANAFRPQAEEKGLELIVDVPDGAPNAVMIDAVRVRQILFNLISNAVKFTQSGGVRVRLQTAPSEKPGRVRIGVSVADTGVGMSRTELAGYLTDRRLGGGRKGLGLSICAKLARLMGAKLGARSTPGQGSMFSFVIDAELCAEAAPQRRQGPRFLVVQHRAPERRALAAVLDMTGVAFDFAEDGARALELLHETRFDLVIADQQAPEFDAADITELLKQGGLNAATPVIALVRSDGERARCEEAGVDGCVGQPTSPPALLDEIARVLGAPPGASWAA